MRYIPLESMAGKFVPFITTKQIPNKFIKIQLFSVCTCTVYIVYVRLYVCMYTTVCVCCVM